MAAISTAGGGVSGALSGRGRCGRVGAGDGDLVELDQASGSAGAERGDGGDEGVHVVGVPVRVERGGVGVDLVEVEASGGVAGLVRGEGDAARFAAHLADQLDDTLAEGAGQAGLGVQNGDHRAGVRVGDVDLQVSVVQACGEKVLGHGLQLHSDAGLDDADGGFGGQVAGCVLVAHCVCVAAGDEPVAEEALGEGVVVGDGQLGLEGGGQLGGLLGVHDDLHVVRGLNVQAVGGQQGQADVAQPMGNLAEFGDEHGVPGEIHGVLAGTEHEGDLVDAVLGGGRGDGDAAGLHLLPRVEGGDVSEAVLAGGPGDGSGGEQGDGLVAVGSERLQVAVVVVLVADQDAVQAGQVGNAHGARLPPG